MVSLDPEPDDDFGMSAAVESLLTPPPMETPVRRTRAESREVARNAAAWAVLVLIVGGLVAAGYYGRNQVVAIWPPTARLYTMVGIPVEPLGAGLQLQNVRSEQKVEDGATVLVVEGQVVNVSDRIRDVPPLRAISRGPDHRPVQSWLISVTPERLLPGESAAFQAVQRDPGPVSEVLVTFDNG